LAVVGVDTPSWRAIAQVALNAHHAPTLARPPLVSVVIATYNWSNVLRCAIESVLRQRYRNWELLVVGDGCTDDTADVVASFTDPRIRWLPLATNSGSQSAPNNHGLGQARGTYVAYLGHDDLWLPNHLSWAVHALERRSAGIAATGCLAMGPPGSNVLRWTCVGVDERAGDWLPPTSVVHRTDAIGTVGTWSDFRQIALPPDVEFVQRFKDARIRGVRVMALTALKFNSAWRPNSYQRRSDDEQRAWLRRMRRDPALVERELIRLRHLRRDDPPERLTETPEPPGGVMPPGWQVAQWRRLRGLPALPGDPPGF
jgi:glycosyltransferase involved in cell wall biosynthesis